MSRAPMASIRWTGALADLAPAARRAILARAVVARPAAVDVNGGARATHDARGEDHVAAERDAEVNGDASRVRGEVAAIVRDVRTRGDAALRDLARRFDGVELASLEVPRAAIAAALDATAPALRRALERAARNVATVHAAQRPSAIEVEPEPGIVVGRRPDPLERVGIYAPGGRAAYPSSVLMGAVPARVAGVGAVVVCSPPRDGGLPPSCVLAAAAIAGVDRVFALGGAGAIAAMAYGTESVPRVDLVAGPGNVHVAEAKRAVHGDVAIDAIAGPSELLAIVFDGADLGAVARELIAQAEHDPAAAVCALVTSADAAADLAGRVVALAEVAPRGEIVRAALARRGAILRVRDIDEAIDFTNDFGAEHVLVAVGQDGAAAKGSESEHRAHDRPALSEVLARLRHAGTVFLGESSSAAFGDYMTGANHVLPTAGAARVASGLSLADYYRWTTYQRVTPEAAARLERDVACLADEEGLSGHAEAARAWRRS